MARTSSTCAFLLIAGEKLARSSIICCKVEHDRAIWGPLLGWLVAWLLGCLVAWMAMARHHFVRRKSGLLPIPSQPQSIIDGHDLSMVPLEWESSSSFLCILRDYYNCNCNYVERRWIVTFEKWTNFKKMPTMRFANVILNDTLKRTKRPFETPNTATERSKIVYFSPRKKGYHTMVTFPATVGILCKHAPPIWEVGNRGHCETGILGQLIVLLAILLPY